MDSSRNRIDTSPEKTKKTNCLDLDSPVKPQGSGSQILSNWAMLIRVDSRQFKKNSISSLSLNS